MRAQVVLLDGERVLLAEHRRERDSYWVLPGGAVEAGEMPEEAAIREVLEETGLHIRVDRRLFVDGPRRHGAITIKYPRHTYLGIIVGGRLACAVGESGNPGNGRLWRVQWMPFESPVYDEQTRDTLRLVRNSLETG